MVKKGFGMSFHLDLDAASEKEAYAIYDRLRQAVADRDVVAIGEVLGLESVNCVSVTYRVPVKRNK
jgi:hypothetical protein